MDDILAEIMADDSSKIGRLLPGTEGERDGVLDDDWLNPDEKDGSAAGTSSGISDNVGGRGRRTTRSSEAKRREHLRDAGFSDGSLLPEDTGSPPLIPSGGFDIKEVDNMPRLLSGGFQMYNIGGGAPIKIRLKRLSRTPSRCKFLGVEGLTKAERRGGAQSGRYSNMPPLDRGSSVESERQIERAVRNEITNFDIKLFSLEPTPSLKLVTDRGRKNLDNLSLEELSTALVELQNMLKAAKERGLKIQEKLMRVIPESEKTSNVEILSAKQLLSMIQEVDVSETVKKAMSAHQIEMENKMATQWLNDGKTDKSKDQASDSRAMDEDKPITKKKDKNKKSRSTWTPKSLWEAWDSYFKYPTPQIIENVLRLRQLPPYQEGEKPDPAFELPDLGPHYTLSEAEKQAFRQNFNNKKNDRRPGLGGAGAGGGGGGGGGGARNISLRQRLVCGLLFDEEMKGGRGDGGDKQRTKHDLSHSYQQQQQHHHHHQQQQQQQQQKSAEMQPAIRAVLSGLRRDDYENNSTYDAMHSKHFKEPQLPALDPAKSKSKVLVEDRTAQELNTIDVLSPETTWWRSLNYRRDTELHFELRDRQVRLYNQLEKNNRWRRKLADAASRAGIPLNVERDLAQLQSAHAELAKAYKAYWKQKKGFDATSVQIVKALTNLNHVRENTGTRVSLTGVDVDPATVDGIPRYEMHLHQEEYKARRAVFERSHRATPINIEVNSSSRRGGSGKKATQNHEKQSILPPMKTNVRSRVNLAGTSEYQASEEIFTFGDEDDDDDDDDDGEQN